MKSIFGDWLRSLDSTLESEASLADLIQHNASAGSIREFLVKGLLERFLPAIVKVETGKVIDAEGGMSKQIDIILFDSRVTCLRCPDGSGIFPVEGVLAAIAVKTRLGSNSDVVNALDNCHSVIERIATGDATFHDAIEKKINDQIREERLTRLEAYIQVMNCAFPPTYVFAINDGISASGLAEAIDTWFQRSKDFVEIVPGIPRMVIAGHRIAVAHDGISKFNPPKNVVDAAFEQNGACGRILAVVWPQVEHRWSWLASHILLSISYRLGIRHDFLQARYMIDRYLPLGEVFEIENQRAGEAQHLLWNGHFPHFERAR